MVEKMKNEISDKRNIFWFLAVGVIVTLVFYIYFVSQTVYMTMLRQQTEKSITTIDSDIADLQASYLALKNDITEDLARAKGFKEVTSTAYISRHPQTGGLSLNAGM